MNAGTVSVGTRAALALLLVVLAVVYGPSLQHGIIPSWDDAGYVLNRPEVVDWWGAGLTDILLTPKTGYPTPVPTFLYAHLRMVFGEQHYFASIHALSLLLHAANSILVFLLSRRWVPAGGALAVTALWALHPVAVETVAWATNLKTLLYAGAMLTAMLAWEKMLDGDNVRRHQLVVGIALVIGLGSRPDMALLPAVLFLQTILREEPRALIRKHVFALAGFGVISAAGLALAIAGHSPISSRSELVTSGIVETAELAAVSLARAFSHWVLPVDLQPAYFADANASLGEVLLGVAILLGGVALVAVGRRIDKSLTIPAGVALAGLFYLPYSQLVFIPRLSADTYLYLPSFGGALALVGMWRIIVSRRLAESLRPRVDIAVVVLLSGVLAIATFEQVQRWENGVTLWEPMVEKYPTVARPYRHVAFEYFRRGEVDEAAAVLDRGMPAMRLHRNIPFWAPLVYQQAGDSLKAANVAMEAFLLRRDDPDPQLARTLLQVLASTEVSLPPDGEAREGVEAAVEIYLDQDYGQEQERAEIAIAYYFARNGEPSLARRFLERPLNSANPPCDAWVVADMVSGEGWTSPPVPGRCERPDGSN